MRHTILCSLLLPALFAAIESPAQTQVWSAPVTQAAPPDVATPGRAVGAGEAVMAASSGGWYRATVLEVGAGGYKVRYDGWGAGWDEWLPPARLRLPDGTPVALAAAAPPPAGPLPPAAAPATSRPPLTVAQAQAAAQAQATAATPGAAGRTPSGRWECATWDAGQLNRIGGFTLNADGSYQDQNSRASGRYTYQADSGRIAFTSGPQKTNAPVTFQPDARGGAGMIVFDYGGGARLDCYRAAAR